MARNAALDSFSLWLGCLGGCGSRGTTFWRPRRQHLLPLCICSTEARLRWHRLWPAKSLRAPDEVAYVIIDASGGRVGSARRLLVLRPLLAPTGNHGLAAGWMRGYHGSCQARVGAVAVRSR